ncbi:hypothetical protein I551_8778 [Mycobacterium ulcerans str. Harvey]|uniref:Uncharacterized protein n=1 Tax=Mycobacterium ulcerans str. Harvey TaxID=1299332 RepID=A0ABN0R9V4_MYCUL|nr:hypothetical protein I551_8778 [Mycobacterium ulcerans str. Harvey]
MEFEVVLDVAGNTRLTNRRRNRLRRATVLTAAAALVLTLTPGARPRQPHQPTRPTRSAGSTP